MRRRNDGLKSNKKMIRMMPVIGAVILMLAPGIHAQDGALQEGARNPFSAPARPARDGALQDVIFDGSRQGGASLPIIRVSGLMTFDGQTAVCADVEGVGPMVFRRNEKIIFGETGRCWFTVRDISRSAMTIELHDGSRIQGRFF